MTNGISKRNSWIFVAGAAHKQDAKRALPLVPTKHTLSIESFGRIALMPAFEPGRKWDLQVAAHLDGEVDARADRMFFDIAFDDDLSITWQPIEGANGGFSDAEYAAVAAELDDLRDLRPVIFTKLVAAAATKFADNFSWSRNRLSQTVDNLENWLGDLYATKGRVSAEQVQGKLDDAKRQLAEFDEEFAVRGQALLAFVEGATSCRTSAAVLSAWEEAVNGAEMMAEMEQGMTAVM